jgi:bacterioferritin
VNQKVIDILNQAREQELHAITQYMTHHYELEDVMYGKLAHRLKKIAIAEMRHAEMLAERILFLGGVPSTKLSDSDIKKKQDVAALLQNDIALESSAVAAYNDFARQCGEEGDHVSKQLFENLAGQEEEHLDEFQNTFDFVNNLGPAYLATLTGGNGD